MPEGDAVRRTANRLDRALAGQVLTGSDLRVPAWSTVDLTGATVEVTATHGKHLLTRLRTLDAERITLHTHLKMEGSWRVVRAGARRPGPDHEIRVVLHTAQVEAFGLALGVVDLLATEREHTAISHLGPDLLGRWTPEDEVVAVSRLTEAPGRALGEALLDQRVVSGMGTIWVAESCFVQGVHPLAPVAAVKDPVRLLRRTRQMMQAAVTHGRPLTTGDRRRPLWAYARHHHPCLRCGCLLESGRIGEPGRERTTYWCPQCQPRPA